eukprot:6788004-Prymnesium_polylepis.1
MSLAVRRNRLTLQGRIIWNTSPLPVRLRGCWMVLASRGTVPHHAPCDSTPPAGEMRQRGST